MITVEIDDFTTEYRTVATFESFMSQVPCGSVKITAFALLSKSDASIINELRDEYSLTIGVHGWNHYQEPRFGYWQARHLLETAISWQCFDRLFVMPWNRMPGLGFLKALRESQFTFVSPYRWQCVIAAMAGCDVKCVKPDYLLHPPDLLLRSEQVDSILEAVLP